MEFLEREASETALRTLFRKLASLLRWIGYTGALNLAWEVVQLPFYTIYSQGRPAEIVFAVAHCTAGDVLIALASYLVAAAVTRNLGWPVHRPGPGFATALTVGIAYTAFSEWLNVSIRGSWAYAAWMPQVWGIGIAPLLQWIIVPAAALYLTRASDRELSGG